MNRKPTTQPEQHHGGRYGHGQGTPTFRPIGPVASDDGRDWIRMREAVILLRAAMPKHHAAERWMLENVRAGLVPITCRLLTYDRRGGGAERVRYQWPGVEARLCEQIDQAVGHGLSGFDVNGATFDLSWLDVTGPYPVEAKMFDTHVDRAAITAAIPSPAALVAAEKSSRPPASDRTGGPGSPSTMHLLEAEMRRRHSEGRLADSLAAEARALAEWFGDQPDYAGLRSATPATIENGLRKLYRELKATK